MTVYQDLAAPSSNTVGAVDPEMPEVPGDWLDGDPAEPGRLHTDPIDLEAKLRTGSLQSLSL